MNKPERHIFLGEAEAEFAESLAEFHDLFVETLLLAGVAEDNVHLEKIKMTKNRNYSPKYFQKIVGGILKFPPSIEITCADKSGTVVKCELTRLNDGKHINNIFLRQKVFNWGQKGISCTQIWRLKDVSMCTLNKYWL